MTNQPDVTVRLDNRIRLMSALLSATTWPEQSQQRRPHGTHAHARATRKHLNEWASHEAVQSMQTLIDQGAPLEAMFTFVLCLSWPGLELEIDRLPGWVPPLWIVQMRQFVQKSNLIDWWDQEDGVWQKSLEDSRKMFRDVSFKPFLKPFLGEVREDLVFVPSISYPTDQEIGVRFGSELLCIVPPRLAWGDSPPWPFDEDPTHIYRAALSQYGHQLLMAYLRAHPDPVAEAAKNPLPTGDQFNATYPTWSEQFTALFVTGAVALYLEDHVSKAEAKAYVLMARKAQGLSILPGVISVLRRYLAEYEAGKHESLIDFLPVFPKLLRVAKRVVSL